MGDGILARDKGVVRLLLNHASALQFGSVNAKSSQTRGEFGVVFDGGDEHAGIGEPDGGGGGKNQADDRTRVNFAI